jgi:hypothetical protein
VQAAQGDDVSRAVLMSMDRAMRLAISFRMLIRRCRHVDDDDWKALSFLDDAIEAALGSELEKVEWRALRAHLAPPSLKQH